MTCRICLEECDEETACACNAFVHKECLEKWLEISGRDDCEICLTPHETRVEYNIRCKMHPYGMNCGDPADNGLFSLIIVSMSTIYFTMLMFLDSWEHVFYVCIACRFLSLIWLLPLRHEIYVENVAFWWQNANFLIVCIARILTYTEELEPSMQEVRVNVMHVELMLCITFAILRCVVGCMRNSMRRRLTMSHDMLGTMNDP